MTQGSRMEEPSTAVAEPVRDLGEELRSACVELMADYGVTAWSNADSPTPQSRPGFTARAEFQGDCLKGSVALFATRRVVEHTARSVIGTGVAMAPLSDWACELVNQLLGRFKNKLRPFDLVVDTGMPTLLPVSDAGATLDGSARYRFSCDQGDFSGYLDVMVPPGFALHRKEPSEPLAWEGDVLFF
jgi:chemotaxis protein CheX